MINYKTINDVGKELQRSKDVILTHKAVWTSVADKVVAADGSVVASASDTTKNIDVMLEPLRKADMEYREIQGITESTSHYMMTLRNWDIQVGDTITYSDIDYKVQYAIPPQYNIDFADYLLEVNDS